MTWDRSDNGVGDPEDPPEAPELSWWDLRTEYRETRVYCVQAVSKQAALEVLEQLQSSRTTCDDVEYSEENLLSVELHEE